MYILTLVDRTKWPPLGLGVIVICLFTVLGSLVAGCGNETVVSPDYEMLASEFLDEFNQDQLAFEEKYADKVISIIGEILIIGQANEVPILDIGTDPEDLYSVYAYFEANSSTLKNLVKGQYVKVIGTYTGQGFYTLELHDCSLLN